MLRMICTAALSLALLTFAAPEAIVGSNHAEACGVKLVVKSKKKPKKRIAAKAKRKRVKSGGTAVAKRKRVNRKAKRKPVAAGRVQARTAAPAPRPTPAVVASTEPETPEVSEPAPRKRVKRKAPAPSADPVSVEVYFELGVARVEDAEGLEEVVSWLNENPRGRLVIEGHTDPQGSSRFNRGLSKRRALQVRAYLREKAGVSNKRMSVKAYGESRLAYPEDSSKNRRVVVKNR